MNCRGVDMSHVMRKLVFAICEQQRRRSAFASAQSDQRLYCLLPGQYNASTCYSRNFKTLARFFSWAGRFVSYPITNPEDRFSCDKAHIMLLYSRTFITLSFWTDQTSVGHKSPRTFTPLLKFACEDICPLKIPVLWGGHMPPYKCQSVEI